MTAVAVIIITTTGSSGRQNNKAQSEQTRCGRLARGNEDRYQSEKDHQPSIVIIVADAVDDAVGDP